MRSMVIVAEPEDALANAVEKQGPSVIRVTPRQWLDECVFSLRISGQVTGFIRIGEAFCDLARLGGVLFRPRGDWLARSDTPDVERLFVGHEKSAAWCALLRAMPCPVINRYGPGWWSGHRCHAADLVAGVAEALRIRAESSANTPAGDAVEHARAYVVGSEILIAQDSACALLDHARTRARALSRWQNDTGILLCELVLQVADPWTLLEVNTRPDFSDPDGSVEDVAAAVTRLLQ